MTRLAPLAVPLLAVALFAGRLFLPLLEPEESLYAELGRQTATGGHWLVPHLHGEPYLDKPPLLYWLTAAPLAAFGPLVWAARVVPVLAAGGCVLVAYLWAKALAGRTAGLLAAVALLLCPDFAYRGPMLTPNGLLALFTTAALACGHFALRGEQLRRRWWLLAAALTAAGVLTKGPVAVVLVLPVLVVLPWCARGLVRPGVGEVAVFAGVVLLVAGPWFAAVAAQRPGFVEYFFWKHHVERYTDPFDHAKPWHFYLPQVFAGGLPWLLVPVVALALWLKRKAWTAKPPADALLPLAAAGLAVLFFSASGSKRAIYLVPVWPPLAVGAGVLLAPWFARPAVRTATLAVAGLTAAVLLAGVSIWLPGYHRKYGVADAADAIAAAGPGLPVLHVPHPWNALSFAGVPGEAVRDDERDKLLARLRDQPKCVVVTKDGPPADEFARTLPPDLTVTARTDHGVTAVLVVERR